MMTDPEIKMLASLMEEAYDSCKTRSEACEYISKQWKGIDPTILKAMWEAIDTYLDTGLEVNHDFYNRE